VKAGAVFKEGLKMDIHVLREEKKAALEIIENKKKLVKKIEDKIEAIRLDGSRLLADRDRLETKFELLDETREAERLAGARSELQSSKDAIRQNADLLEATEKVFAKEKANIQDLEKGIVGIEQKIRLFIADREACKAREAAHVVNRALVASQIAGSFENFERFFIHTFGISESDRSAMRNEFESEAK
jgi:hypothetical protein